MSTGTLTIDLDAIARNWRALDAKSAASVETAATVKADGYGLGVDRVVNCLARAGARRFFVAVAEEGAAVREALGPGPAVHVYSGHMAGDTEMIGDLDLVPMLNSIEQVTRHLEALPGKAFGIQFDSGMNRLGMEPEEWAAIKHLVLPLKPELAMSHLACADEPDHEMNSRQLKAFREMAAEIDAPLSLAATGGILLGEDYHFDVVRPGIGLYGGRPFDDAEPVARLSLPVIQTRDVRAGEPVGYGNSWVAEKPARIATVSAGYADGILGSISNRGALFADDEPCPLVGRVSMDLVAADVTRLDREPSELYLLSDRQTADEVAEAAGTSGYEILVSLGNRYQRRHSGGAT